MKIASQRQAFPVLTVNMYRGKPSGKHCISSLGKTTKNAQENEVFNKGFLMQENC